ncbi:serine/threonine-protein phosphatase [Pectobacterium versatile]|uniref:PP2C family protein-serine/threonine phosphatase n=1 Tax=Pectobacterium versatile TaxID=2488639 RepID=UPI00102EF882|nr:MULTISPECIES: PP2C family serine/threonine-protein phosphatase [Pectobacterium]MBD0846850.1 protein phosphatase [Pectobacterium carotovorum subsp. carotovorum]MBK4824206.1 protein-serine/threonine phosphatase [Pectobacterium carotovorum subsp. carotovorum]MCA6915466.1 serine/threonine-protein phosphatase [Pectobacterium versatile]TAJ03465.1 serine/threonine-protein phosphatase [Pectobacterium versatile]UNE79035.1 serine/threonine-protein phosphatase [Pectobacterium versatile]
MFNLISASFFSFSKENKQINQDTILPPLKINDGYLFAIADGLGGYKGGDKASQRVIEYLAKNFKNEMENYSIELFPNLKEDLKKLSEFEKEYVNAASTLTFCYVTQYSVIIGHIGDCRLYIKNKSKLDQLTKDHTQHQAYIDDGIFTSRQLKNAKGKNILTTAISKTLELKYNIINLPFKELADEEGYLSIFIMSDGAHSFWEKRPRFSINTLSEPSRFSSSLKKRIENGPPIDDYSLISVKFSSQGF